MARQIVDITTVQANGKRGEPAPSAFAKLNANDGELYTLVGVGGIVDSGSNSSGSYVKYADGTMICRRNTTGSVAVNNQIGSIFVSASIGFTFPEAFVDIPSISPYAITPGAAISWAAAEGSAQTTGFTARAVSLQNSNTYVGYIAIGRWK